MVGDPGGGIPMAKNKDIVREETPFATLEKIAEAVIRREGRGVIVDADLLTKTEWRLIAVTKRVSIRLAR